VSGSRGAIRILPEKCSGCGRCVAACREGLFTLDLQGTRKIAVIRHPERCTLCRRCIEECRIGALAETA
jgi:NAD-dependent dihydropyrimidine dehydrogenase PreA subunit